MRDYRRKKSRTGSIFLLMCLLGALLAGILWYQKQDAKLELSEQGETITPLVLPGQKTSH